VLRASASFNKVGMVKAIPGSEPSSRVVSQKVFYAID